MQTVIYKTTKVGGRRQVCTLPCNPMQAREHIRETAKRMHWRYRSCPNGDIAISCCGKMIARYSVKIATFEQTDDD